MERGTCVAWRGGFGFVRPDGATRRGDLFVFYKSLLGMEGRVRALHVDDRVEFTRGVDGSGRPQAINVRLVEAE